MAPVSAAILTPARRTQGPPLAQYTWHFDSSFQWEDLGSRHGLGWFLQGPNPHWVRSGSHCFLRLASGENQTPTGKDQKLAP